MAAQKKKRIVKRRKRHDFFDYNLLAAVILLITFGLIMLYSASAYESASKFNNNDMYYFKHQLLLSSVAIVAALLVARIDFVKYKKWFFHMYIISLVLMFMVRFTPLGIEAFGARRWLGIGPISFQPAEVAKIVVILYCPLLICNLGREIRGFQEAAIILLIGYAQAAAAFIFTDNLSTAIIIAGICTTVVFLAHPKTKPFILIALGVIVVVVAFLIFVRLNLNGSENFRMRRILAWLQPEKYLSNGGYQVMQGLYAIGSGGLFGKGLGNSTQKLATIPEAQNDMIFTIICEELGLFGALMVLLMFGYLLYRLFVIAQNAPDRYSKLVVSGIFVHVALQVILNICVVLNLIPTTGVTLPFMSYGGTSVIFLMIEIGIALSVSRKTY